MGGWTVQVGGWVAARLGLAQHGGEAGFCVCPPGKHIISIARGVQRMLPATYAPPQYVSTGACTATYPHT
jgi:hypothetical protein